MAHYLIQVSYTPEAWAKLIRNPHDRSKSIQAVVEKLGGKMENFWLTLGEYDVVGLLQMPDDVTAAAFAMAVSAGGACKAVKTTPLLSMAEAQGAMKKAAASGYKPVSAKK